jgi:hypothetical protein
MAHQGFNQQARAEHREPTTNSFDRDTDSARGMIIFNRET